MVYQYFHRALGHPQTSCYFLLTVWNFFLIFPLNMIDVIVIVFYNLQIEIYKFVHNFDKLCKKFYRGFRGRMKACQTLGVVSRICLCWGPCLIFVNPWLSPSDGDTTPGLEACHLKTDFKWGRKIFRGREDREERGEVWH